MFSVEGRLQDDPLIVHAVSFEQAKEYMDNFHPAAEKIVKDFWPGPLTLTSKIKKGTLSPVMTGGSPTATFRIPNNKKTLEIIGLSDVPLVNPSANMSEKSSPATADHVYHDLQGKVTGIIDDGATRIGAESAILDLSDLTATPTVLRSGVVMKEQIEVAIESPVAIDQYLAREDETSKAPRMKHKHYSLDTRVLVVRDGDWLTAIQWAKNKKIRAGIIVGPGIADQVWTDITATYMCDDGPVEVATKGLLAGLRGLGESVLGLDLILVQAYPETGLGSTYISRLKKAAGQSYFEK